MNIKIFPGKEEDINHYIEKSEDEINYYKYQLCDILYFNILCKISLLHKKYAINKKTNYQDRYNLALKKEIEYNNIVSDIKNNYKDILNLNNEYVEKIKQLLNITKININYRLYNSKMYLIKNS